jgi:hypothetical protein
MHPLQRDQAKEDPDKKSNHAIHLQTLQAPSLFELARAA